MPHSQHATPARGVYQMLFRDAAGNHLMAAFASDGRRLAELPFKPDTEDHVRRILFAVLCTADPIPLKLVG